MTQLLIHLDYLYKAKCDRSNHFVSTVYVDFKKAFDEVSHRVLLQKLWRLGIQGTLFEILKSNLEDRKQCVRINGKYSDEADVTSGVPQGSILGPLLFVTYVNDSPELFISLCKLFADDLKIYSISRLDLEEGILRLRRWCIDNRMEVNGVKCGGHGNKFERISSNFNFEWTKFEFSKNRNKFESLCSNYEQTAVSIKRTSDISPIHLVPRGPLGPLMLPSC